MTSLVEGEDVVGGGHVEAAGSGDHGLEVRQARTRRAHEEPSIAVVLIAIKAVTVTPFRPERPDDGIDERAPRPLTGGQMRRDALSASGKLGRRLSQHAPVRYFAWTTPFLSISKST